MEHLKHVLDPLIESLPGQIQDYWFLIVCIVGLLILLPVAWYQRRLLEVLVTGGRAAVPRLTEPPAEDLATYEIPQAAPAAASVTGQARRLLIEGVPARLQLVVIAPLGTMAAIDESQVEDLLNLALWGLGPLARQEQARIRIWPPQLSAHGFAAIFHRMVHRPEAEGQSSNWILLAGHTPPRPRPLLLGLACWTDEKTTIGRVVINPHEWMSLLRIELIPASTPTIATPTAPADATNSAPATMPALTPEPGPSEAPA